jgi:hypothetical protein
MRAPSSSDNALGRRLFGADTSRPYHEFMSNDDYTSISLCILSELSPTHPTPVSAISAGSIKLRALSDGQLRTRLSHLVELGLARYERGRGWTREVAGESALAANSLDIIAVLTKELERIGASALAVSRDDFGRLCFTGLDNDSAGVSKWGVLLRLLGTLDDDAGESSLHLVLAAFEFGYADGYQECDDDATSAAMSAER